MVSKITTLERQVIDLQTQNLSLKFHNEELAERNKSLIDNFELEKMYLEAKLEDQRFETNRVAKLHLETIIDLQETEDNFNKLDENLEMVQIELSNVRTEKIDLEQVFYELDMKMQDVMTENDDLRAQVAHDEDLSNEWLSYKEDVEKLLKEQSDSLNEQRIMYQELSEKYNELTEQYSDISEREKFITHRNAQTEMQLELVENELKVKESHLEIFKDNIERLERSEQDLQHEITELTRMFSDIAKGRARR